MALFSKQKTVPKSTYDTLQEERDAFEREVKRLQEQVHDLTGKCTAMAFDETITRGLAKRTITFLGTLEAGHKVGVARQKEIDALVAEAKAAGLVPEKEKEE